PSVVGMGLLDTLPPTGRSDSSGTLATDTLAPDTPAARTTETGAWARASGLGERVSRGRTPDTWAPLGRSARDEAPEHALPWAVRGASGPPGRSAAIRPKLRHRLTRLRTRPLPPAARRARILLWRRRHLVAA